MIKSSVLEKEQLIIGTIINCNNEMKKLSGIVNLNETSNNIYHYNFCQLLSEINPLFENISFEKEMPKNINKIENSRNNFYAYFKKVDEFLNGYELNVQTFLNESLKIDELKIENPKQLDILSFKNDLKLLIKELSKKNDFDNIPPDILKIKILAKKPLYVYGFDIVNNLGLQKELYNNFNILFNDLLSICFDKSNNQLLFIQNSDIINTVVYDLKTDNLDYYNKINEDNLLKSEILNSKNYYEIIKKEINNNIVEIYINIEAKNFTITDNLYFDVLRQNMVKDNENNINENRFSFVKK
jgi:hypothetical protein